MPRPTDNQGQSTPTVTPAPGPFVQAHLTTRNLGRINYTDALAQQELEHARILAARETPTPHTLGTILIVEHQPVITVSQRPNAQSHLLASRESLAHLGIDVQPTDRGGDITYHGPGQIVLYPIIDLNAFNLRLHDYMRLLEQAIIDTLEHFHIPAQREQGATGVWVPRPNQPPAKVAALGVRVRRWITTHGLALNVAVNLKHFDLIVPCGLTGREVTSMDKLLPPPPPTFDQVHPILVNNLAAALAQRL